jgi:hypothetical protein
MKKQLLFGGALLLSISAFSQSARQSANRHLFEGAKLVEYPSFQNRFIQQNMDLDATTAAKFIGPKTDVNPSSTTSNASASSPILNTTWYRLSGSGNIFGMLVSASKPLNYQRILGAVTFIQRKSGTYVVTPASDGNVGTIVAYIGKNDAVTNSLASWDSTCIWAEPTNQGRYPSGGLWNILPGNGNTDLNKAYVVGAGPVTTGSGWVGSWYASKSVTATPKNGAGTVAGEEQFFSNASPFNTAQSAQMHKHDFPRYGFNVTDQAVWIAGYKMENINGTTAAAQGYRGASLSKGAFTSGIMIWGMDSLIPPVAQAPADNSKIMSEPYLKFTPDGQLGYAMFIGVRQGAAVGSSNRGKQPIVYKTTNGGGSWNIVNGIDFDANTPGINQIKNSIRSVGGVTPQYEAPWFWGEGIDMTIDASGRLHIIATVIGHASSHLDSMNYLSRWTIATAGPDDYHWPHVPTANPLIVDYYGDGVAPWKTLIIDSLWTEGPGTASGDPGYSFNPWASATAGESTSSDSRLQITRSYDGEFLTYSWAESDTIITSQQNKWNEFPNLKVRAFRNCDESLSPDEFSITGQASTLGAVKDKAYFHYMSGEMKAGASSATSATFAIPFTVSSNPATDGITPVSNYFAMSHLQYSFPSAACGASITTGVAANRTEVMESMVYPNPTENNFNVRMNLSTASDVVIAVYNAIGQKVAETKANGTVGENVVPVNLNNASAGIYFVKIKAGKSETTKKLVVE